MTRGSKTVNDARCVSYAEEVRVQGAATESRVLLNRSWPTIRGRLSGVPEKLGKRQFTTIPAAARLITVERLDFQRPFSGQAPRKLLAGLFRLLCRQLLPSVRRNAGTCASDLFAAQDYIHHIKVLTSTRELTEWISLCCLQVPSFHLWYFPKFVQSCCMSRSNSRYAFRSRTLF